MNLPNLLSLSRIALMPFIILALKDGRPAVLLLLMLAAAATDFFDGYLARRHHQVSQLGKVLDPLADKICIGGMAVALWLWRGFPGWAVALILARDLLILLGGLWLVRRRKTVPLSNRAGKAAVTLLAATVICYALDWQPWGQYLLYASALMVLASGLIYLKKLGPTRAAAR
jgi:CDP-diacylglycerol--glycerol-3-phosphate 3-phosphatidyltransferase